MFSYVKAFVKRSWVRCSYISANNIVDSSHLAKLFRNLHPGGKETAWEMVTETRKRISRCKQLQYRSKHLKLRPLIVSCCHIRGDKENQYNRRNRLIIVIFEFRFYGDWYQVCNGRIVPGTLRTALKQWSRIFDRCLSLPPAAPNCIKHRFSANVQTGPGADPATCTMGTGSLSRE